MVIFRAWLKAQMTMIKPRMKTAKIKIKKLLKMNLLIQAQDLKHTSELNYTPEDFTHKDVQDSRKWLSSYSRLSKVE